MTDKLTPKSMKDQYDHQWNVFCKKNHDYGNSFEKSLDTFGLVAGIVRMNDKFERLVSLNDPSKDAQIASESLVDTLEDLSNYAAMAACWLKGKKAADWKELCMKELDGTGITVYAENDNKPFSGIKFHDLPEVSGRTIGEKLMDKEYNGLGVASDESIERFNALIDRLIYYMDEGDSVTITGIADREFNVVINSTRIRGKRNE